MKSNKAREYFQRPGSSARVYDSENSSFNSSAQVSKISKLPKRTYSLEGKTSSCMSKKSNTRGKISTTSMIPRREETKRNRKISAPCNVRNNVLTVTPTQENLPNSHNSSDAGKLTDRSIHQSGNRARENLKNSGGNTQQSSFNEPPSIILNFNNCPSEKSLTSLESKVRKDLKNFKESVFKIPEYWTDAGEAVTSILKNAINIITKQYPTADVESFENDIQNVLKATEAVKQQILLRIESIVSKANYLYNEKATRNMIGGEDLKKITMKMESLKNEVSLKRNVFGDLFKYGSEMKELLEVEQLLKRRTGQKENPPKDPIQLDGVEFLRKSEKRKSRVEGKDFLKSCGDVDLQCSANLLREDKTTQTIYSWTEDLSMREKDLKELNKQILELHQLCKEHLSKFKNINLQIKMKGAANKSCHRPTIKDFHIFHEDESGEKNDDFTKSNSDTDSSAKQKSVEHHRKDKALRQQKKLLQVRDELIGMLKNRCHMEEGAKC